MQIMSLICVSLLNNNVLCIKILMRANIKSSQLWIVVDMVIKLTMIITIQCTPMSNSHIKINSIHIHTQFLCCWLCLEKLRWYKPSSLQILKHHVCAPDMYSKAISFKGESCHLNPSFTVCSLPHTGW